MTQHLKIFFSICLTIFLFSFASLSYAAVDDGICDDADFFNLNYIYESGDGVYSYLKEAYIQPINDVIYMGGQVIVPGTYSWSDCGINDPVNYEVFLRNQTTLAVYPLFEASTSNLDLNFTGVEVDTTAFPDGLYDYVVVNGETSTEFVSDVFIDNTAPTIEFAADPFELGDPFDPSNQTHYVSLDIVDNSGFFEPNFFTGLEIAFDVDWGYHSAEETLYTAGNINYIGFNNYNLPNFPFTGFRFSFLPDYSFFDYAGNEIDPGPYYVPESEKPYIFMATNNLDIDQDDYIDGVEIVFSEDVQDDSLSGAAFYFINSDGTLQEVTSVISSGSSLLYVFAQDTELFTYEYPISISPDHDLTDMNGNRFLYDTGSYNYDGDYNSFGLSSAETKDLDADGKLDAVKVYFSDAIDDMTIDTANFSFSNGASIVDLDYSAGCGGPDRNSGENYLCFIISENPTDYDTGEVFEVIYNPYAGGDILENQSNTGSLNYYTVVEATDTAPPVQVGIGELYGHPEAGNYLVNGVEVIFSEPVNGADYYLQIEGVDWLYTSGNGTDTLLYNVVESSEYDGGLYFNYNYLFTTFYDVSKITDLAGNFLMDVPGQYPSQIGDLVLILGYYRDLNQNGKIDAFHLYFSHDVDDTSLDYTDFAIDGFTITGIQYENEYYSDYANDYTVMLTVEEAVEAATYLADAPTITLTYDETSPITGYGTYSSYTANSYSFAASDGANSVLQDILTQDEDEDGYIDAAYFYYTEPSYDGGQDNLLDAPFSFNGGFTIQSVLNNLEGLTIYTLNNPFLYDSSFRPTAYYPGCCIFANEDGNDAVIPEEFLLSDGIGPRVIDVYTDTNDIVYVQFNESITWEDYDLDSFNIFNIGTDDFYVPDSFFIDVESSILELQFPEGIFTSLNLADFVIEYGSVPDAEIKDTYGNIANPVGTPFSITNLYQPELVSAETITTYSILLTFSDLVANVDATDFTFTNIVGDIFDIEVLDNQVLITFDTAFSPNLDNATVSIAEVSDIISVNNGVSIDPLVENNSSLSVTDGIDPTLVDYNAEGSEDITSVYDGENILITFELDSDDYVCTVESSCVKINGGPVDAITYLGDNLYQAAFDPAVLGECVNCTFNLTFTILDAQGNDLVEEILDYASGLTFIDEIRPSAPALSLLDPTALTANSVTLNAEITNIGSNEITAQGFFVGGIDRGADSPSLDLGAFSLVLTGLTCNTTYNYYAYATNIVGNTVTGTSSFLTLACPEDEEEEEEEDNNSGGSSGGSSGSSSPSTPSRPAAPTTPPVVPPVVTPAPEATPAPEPTPSPAPTTPSPTPETDAAPETTPTADQTSETTNTDSTQTDSSNSTSDSVADQSGVQTPSYEDQYQELSTTLRESNPDITETEIESVAEYINLDLPFTPANTSTQKLFDMIDIYLENNQPQTFDYANSCSSKIISTTTDKDTDRDGCSDALEKAYGMDPTTPDMLACNISVAANYNDCSTVPVEVPSEAFLKLNLKANPTKFSDSEFLVPGSVSLSMDLELEDDEVCFAARDKDESRGLDYELGCYEVEYLNEIKGFNYDRKIANFAFMNNKDLADGEYRVLAYGQASNSTKVFDYQDIVIDRAAPTIPLELVEFAGLSADDVTKAKLVRLDPNSDQVYAVFKTNPNTAVEAYWNSILLTSNILADSTSGLAYVELPTWFDLESNETHKLTAYAYSLSDPSAISQTYSLKFKLNSKADQITQLLLIAGAITVIGGLLTLNRFRLKRLRQAKLN